MDWYKVPGFQQPNQPFITKVLVNGKNICLVGYEGSLYAVSSSCPHAGADLSYGWCTDGKLVCPLHRYAYSLRTGKGSPGQNDYINAYAVKVKEDGVYIGMNSFWQRVKNAFK